MDFTYNKNNISNAKKMRREMTPWEGKLWLFFLRSFKYHVYRQRCIYNYILDFYCPKARLAIELDGSQHYEESGQEKDAERNLHLSKLGIFVLHIPNNEIDKNFKGVCEYISNEIEKRIETLQTKS